MGLFSRKPKVNLDDVFKEKYKALNQTMMQAHQEMDDFIKESLLYKSFMKVLLYSRTSSTLITVKYFII